MEDYPSDLSLTFGREQIHDSFCGLSLSERRRHIYSIGSTGVGKTTLLKNLVVQDFHNGRGCTVIDPHGDAARELANAVPRHRLNDCIFFDTSDTEHPIAFNPLDRVPKRHHSLVVSSLMNCFESQWGYSQADAPRMSYILRHCLSTLIVQPPQMGVTLLSVPKMLTDDTYRAHLLKRVRDPIVLEFWDKEFDKLDKRERDIRISPILNKFAAYGQRTELRNIIGQPRSGINFTELMDKGRILVVNLSKATLGEDGSSLLGALIVSSLQQASYRRDAMPEDYRVDHFLYVDEFQSIRSDKVFCSILSEARKYRLGLFLSHQFCAQIDQTVSNAIFGNCGTLCAFSVGNSDAQRLAPAFSPLTPNMLSASGQGEFLFAARRNGEIMNPVLVKARHKPIACGSYGRVVNRTRCVAAKNKTVEDVERAIYSFYEGFEKHVKRYQSIWSDNIKSKQPSAAKPGRKRKASRKQSGSPFPAPGDLFGSTALSS